jgi:hypothetical protein
MQYGTLCEPKSQCPTPMSHEFDIGYKRYAGWENTIRNDKNYNTLFDNDRLQIYQRKITELLEGVGPNNRPIIVPLETIASVLFQCYDSGNKNVGDIYSRYIQPSIEASRNDTKDIVDRAINIIVSTISNEYGMIENNKKLTIWNTVLGDFNKEGLRAHPPIKIRKRRSERMQFNMTY